MGNAADARRIPLEDRTLCLGSGPDADVVLADRFVSQLHCRLEPVRGGVMLRDLGSRNGTWVQGQRVSAVELGAGASFRLGRTDLRLVPRGRYRDARESLVASSPAMLGLLAEVEQLAPLKLPVVIYGESGAGKEGIARALHSRSGRTGPFVALNAGGLPAGTIESELFGHEKGAFTGAMTRRRGVFEQADGGTLFLDEIGELPLELQSRLLRVLETWEVRRLGSEVTRRVNVRLVCATHRDLRGGVNDGCFREDLYYRVHQLPLEVPPLRTRPEDIEPLARHFLESMEEQLGARELAPDAVAVLVAQRWPGNVRELRNVVTSAAARSAGRVLHDGDMMDALRRAGVERPERPLDDVVEAVRAHYGNVAAAARALGMPRSTVRDRVRRWEEGVA
ncbi:MAG: sigma 54-dependent Fis family transcriptional regulator [Sandaracinus sp.]|nr:sigma 54-dependent Fis family transcriptional regulator [Sandaracinus sp.]